MQCVSNDALALPLGTPFSQHPMERNTRQRSAVRESIAQAARTRLLREGLEFARAAVFASAALRSPRALPALVAAGLALVLAPALAGPHEHGVVYLDVAVDGPVLTAQMRAPLESLLGFERAPRTEAERKAADDLLGQLREPGAVLLPAPAAGCVLQSSQVHADLLQGRADAARGGHAELQAHYQWHCARPGQLRDATVPVFDRYRRTRKVEVQVVGPRGQSRATLRPASRTLTLAR